MLRTNVAVRASDDDEEQQLLRNNKKTKIHGIANYDLMRLRDMERFIFKFYWMVILMFIAIGIVIVTVLSERSFEEIFMAESLLSTVGITAYCVLVLLLLMCHSHKEMRIVILLMLCWFVGMVAGFLLALHLLNITIDIKQHGGVNTTGF
tara:strand:- start:753 stop:1202 length:450 start_codon:yes stop_codon:yes gene_type:complete